MISYDPRAAATLERVGNIRKMRRVAQAVRAPSGFAWTVAGFAASTFAFFTVIFG